MGFEESGRKTFRHPSPILCDCLAGAHLLRADLQVAEQEVEPTGHAFVIIV